MSVTVTPDYFAAAVDFAGISDWLNSVVTLPELARPGLKNNFHHDLGDAADPVHVEDILACSPITMVD